jgi:tRNA dimethylallyltransferase
MSNKTCIIVTGATAVGKTDYAIELAGKYHTQIISADSRQCYKELNIGVAKPSTQQLKNIHHYFINSHSIHDEVNVKIFEQYALNAVQKIFQSNDVAIMVGGTGLYIKAFCEGLDELPDISNDIQTRVREAYEKKGIAWLQDEIKKKDPRFFAGGEMQNPQRMMRALAITLATGKSILDYHSGKKIKRDFEIQPVHLELKRTDLYERINSRVDNMMKTGLLHEATSLFPYRHLNALQTVGYKELFDFLEAKTLPGTHSISLDEAVENIKRNTRHFAKRQITWFKKYGAKDGFLKD